MPMRTLLLAIFLVCTVGAPCSGQVDWSGQAAVQILKSASTTSSRVVNGGRATFGWQSDLFLDGVVSDNVAVLSDVSVTDQERPSFDYLAIRFVDLTPLHLNLQAGKFDMPFGNLAERRFPRNNPLYSLPLLYEYSTSFQNWPTTDNVILRGRGQGAGMRLLDGGIYDIGAMVYGATGIVTYAVAVSNGTVSTPAYGNENINSNFGTILRVTMTPLIGLTIGAGYAWGDYLYDQHQPSGLYENPAEYLQRDGEIDVSFSRGHFVSYAEAVYGIWKAPLDAGDENLEAVGYYLEGKYTVIPRFYVALRVGGLRFNEVQLGGVDQRWDFNVTEWEGGLGYFVERNVVLKLVRRETRTFGGSRPRDNLSVMQLAVEF